MLPLDPSLVLGGSQALGSGPAAPGPTPQQVAWSAPDLLWAGPFSLFACPARVDAVLLNNIVQNFGMLDLVKKVLASHKCQMDRSREQYARDLAGTLASAVPTGAWVCGGRHGVGDTGTAPARPPRNSPIHPPHPPVRWHLPGRCLWVYVRQAGSVTRQFACKR